MKHFTSLTAAMLLLLPVLVLGFWLSTRWLVEEVRPRARIAAGAHALGGAAVLALVLRAGLASVPHHAGPGRFGWMAIGMLGAALLLGVLILAVQMLRRQPKPLLVAVHACAGIAAATILAAYWANPSSYGR